MNGENEGRESVSKRTMAKTRAKLRQHRGKSAPTAIGVVAC